MCNCLYCYRPLLKGEKHMHTTCIKKFFGTTFLPVLDYTTARSTRSADYSRPNIADGRSAEVILAFERA